MILSASPGAPTERACVRRRYAKRGAGLDQRLSQYADTSGGPDACHPWRGHTSADGYAQTSIGGRDVLVHRAVLERKLGRALVPGEVSRHSCHRRDCTNERHLEPGSVADNVHDAVAARRHAHGETTGTAKLTEEQVIEIRRLAAGMGHGRFELLGRRYGVTGKQIANIVRGVKWRHVPTPSPVSL